MNLSRYTLLAVIFLLTFACKKDLAPLSGCTDPNAINYNSLACVDDSSCLPIILGCTNINATNNPAQPSTE